VARGEMRTRRAGRASLRKGGSDGKAPKTRLNAGGRRENSLVRFEKARTCIVMKCALPGLADEGAPKESMELLLALKSSVERLRWYRVPSRGPRFPLQGKSCGRMHVRLVQGE
jgi:hypothetical protein